MDLTAILLEVATILLDLRTLLLDLRALQLRYHAAWQEAFQYIVWFSASFPFCPLLKSYFSHLFPFSVTQGLSLVSTVKVPHLGTFTWFQYLNFPPCASHQFSYISFINWVSISILPP